MTTNSDGGTYTLLIDLAEQQRVAVGALGTHTFERGYYAYVGSALGPGGFARLDRHRELASGERDTRHWHIDYLLGTDAASLVDDVRSEGVDAECKVARLLAAEDDTLDTRMGARDSHDVSTGAGDTLSLLDGKTVPGFGCSDCQCDSHLYFHPREAVLRSAVESAHGAVRTG